MLILYVNVKKYKKIDIINGFLKTLILISTWKKESLAGAIEFSLLYPKIYD